MGSAWFTTYGTGNFETIQKAFTEVKSLTMRIFYFFILLLLSRQVLHGQNVKQDGDTLSYKKILIIPYDPRYYISDADRDIALATKLNPAAFRKTFREESTRNVFRAVALHWSCVSIMEDTSQELFEDVAKVMSKTGYKYDSPAITDSKALKEKIFQLNPEKHSYDSRTSSQYLNEKPGVKYMRAVLTEPELLKNLYTKYNFDVFVFVTQMEIKTNFSSCLDIANKIYNREVMLHFTVYDINGKLIAGNFANSSFPSNENNAHVITGRCFPQLAEGIVKALRNSYYR